MIKDLMIRLDGTVADEARLAVAQELAQAFNSRIVALFFNIIPVVLFEEETGVAAAEMLQRVHEVGDRTEAILRQRLARLHQPAELRRFDDIANGIGDIAAQEARAADVFLALRADKPPDDRGEFVEPVLFGSGRHVLVFPERRRDRLLGGNVILGWNGSREAARAMAESLPYLRRAVSVTVSVVTGERAVEAEAALGEDAVSHLRQHDIPATLRRVEMREDAGATLIREARELDAHLIVIGGYGHSRLREYLLGGTTRRLLREAPVPLLIAH
jgi:nucleotide-binding universal stress UspA family protein